MRLTDIDTEVNKLTQQFTALVNLFNMKSNLEKDKMFSLNDVVKSRNEAQKMVLQYNFAIRDFMTSIADESVDKQWQDEKSADSISNIYFAKMHDVIEKNINLLIAKHIRNAKDMVIRNKTNRHPKLFEYSHNTIYDAKQRQISLSDKFKKDVRKVLIDFYNDLKLFGAYNNGKRWAYTITPSGAVYKRFLISDYVKTNLKDKIFHPNVQSLAYVED